MLFYICWTKERYESFRDQVEIEAFNYSHALIIITPPTLRVTGNAYLEIWYIYCMETQCNQIPTMSIVYDHTFPIIFCIISSHTHGPRYLISAGTSVCHGPTQMLEINESVKRKDGGPISLTLSVLSFFRKIGHVNKTYSTKRVNKNFHLNWLLT